MRRLATLLLLALTLPTCGCCSLARLFCGPDTSAWVSIDYSTPARALQTLLEAFRRDDAHVVSTSLTRRFCAEKGVDTVGLQVFYQQMKAETPGLHLVGYAAVPEPTFDEQGRATFALDVEGTAVDVTLVRETRWEVAYRRPNGTLGETGERTASLDGLAQVERLGGEDERSRLTLRPMTFFHLDIDAVPLADIEYAGVRRQWKVDAMAIRR